MKSISNSLIPVIFSCLLLTISIFLGYYIEYTTNTINYSIKNDLIKVSSQVLTPTFYNILLNNLVVILRILLGSFTFGVYTIIIITLNGFNIGSLMAHAMDVST